MTLNQPAEPGGGGTGAERANASNPMQALQPYRLLAHAIVEFQLDLAAADGWSNQQGAADPRLGALVARSVAALMELYGERCSQEEQAIVSALRSWMLQGCDDELSPP